MVVKNQSAHYPSPGKTRSADTRWWEKLSDDGWARW